MLPNAIVIRRPGHSSPSDLARALGLLENLDIHLSSTRVLSKVQGNILRTTRRRLEIRQSNTGQLAIVVSTVRSHIRRSGINLRHACLPAGPDEFCSKQLTVVYRANLGSDVLGRVVDVPEVELECESGLVVDSRDADGHGVQHEIYSDQGRAEGVTIAFADGDGCFREHQWDGVVLFVEEIDAFLDVFGYLDDGCVVGDFLVFDLVTGPC